MNYPQIRARLPSPKAALCCLPDPPSPSLTVSWTPAVYKPSAGGPLIHADRVALRQLEFYIRTGVNAIRGRGIEVGGLILGRLIDWNAGEVVITGFVPVEIEYRFGPTFRPSEADVHTFREAAAEEDGNVIGYFRSQLRDGLSLREEDRHLLTELFRAKDCCFAGAFADSQTPTTIDLHKVRAGAAPVLLERFPLKERDPSVPVVERPTDNRPLEPIFAVASEVPVTETPVTLTSVIEEMPVAETFRVEDTPVAETLLVEEVPVAERLRDEEAPVLDVLLVEQIL